MKIQPILLMNKLNFKSGVDNYFGSSLPKPLEKDTFEKTVIPISDKTFEEAKNTVMKTILSENPIESCVFINNDKIICYTTGDMSSVYIDKNIEQLANNPDSNIIAIHSHPDSSAKGITNPVSIGDFANLNHHQGEKCVYAINSNGEYSVIKKIRNDVIPPNVISAYREALEDEIEAALDKEDKQKLIKFHSIDLSQLSEDEFEELQKEYKSFIKSSSFQKATVLGTHNFWIKYAYNLGVEYDTNYSYLS